MKFNRVCRAAEEISNLGSLNFFSKSFKTEAKIAGPRVWTSTRASLEILEGSVRCFLETWKSLSLSISSKMQSNFHLDNLCVLLAQSLTASEGGEGVVDGGGGRCQPLLPPGPDGGTAKVDHQRAHLTWEWNHTDETRIQCELHLNQSTLCSEKHVRSKPGSHLAFKRLEVAGVLLCCSQDLASCSPSHSCHYCK